MSEISTTPLTAADGTPLKKKLAQAMFRSRVRAVGLVLPLLGFVLASFVFPILALMWQGVYNDTFERLMPNLTEELRIWDGVSEPTEEMYALLVLDLKQNRADRTIGKVASRVNQELSGTRSLFTSTARKAEKIEPPYRESLVKIKKKWGKLEVWQAMKLTNESLTPGYYATSLDKRYTVDQGFIERDKKRQIYTKLFIRTLFISGSVMFLCLLLGYPVAYLLATLPLKYSNLLMIMVLLPFWTSLLVRTTAWIAILQSQGVVNDLLVWVGITADDSRFSLIYNMTGTIIAMTHILLPFMILPLYSVMKTIPPSYMRAARSLGATPTLAFIRVYMPQTVPGIGAGGLLVFILAIGYYITPALVGGQDGQLISNMIAYHMQKSLNWSLAAALGGILLGGVLVLYWAYDRIIGIDNMKLG
ncbi:MAG: ABC transporter permease [SAR116 cluster bacterium]|nr:MAG: ABC transporter permease [SAR116 cluster bacterium]|tara:strand:+ start:1026 stop:2279 length:1254 start_codon:yes stop_codon:yes gene_type:complete